MAFSLFLSLGGEIEWEIRPTGAQLGCLLAHFHTWVHYGAAHQANTVVPICRSFDLGHGDARGLLAEHCVAYGIVIS